MNLFEAFQGNNHGLGAYAALKARCLAAIAPGAPENALNRILVAIIDDFVDTFDNEPFPSSIASEAHEEMLLILKRAAAYEAQSASERLAALNEIAGRQLFKRR